MTNTELKSGIDTDIRLKTADGSISKGDVADNLDLIIDYVDQEISALPVAAKTSGTVTLSATPSELPYDVNSCSFGGGIAYLPATTEIGKEILVIANANITIRANAANSAKLFEVFGTYVSSVSLAVNDVCRFTYIGFSGYWKVETI